MPEGSDLALEIKEAMEIDETNILEELRRHSAKYFYYGVLWARATKQKRKIHLKVKELEAALTNDLRVRVAQAGDPKAKVTAEMKNDYLYSQPEFLSAQQDEIQAMYMEEVLEVAKDGMRQRGMALQELAKQNRSEEIYGSEFKAMKNEFNERVEDMGKDQSLIKPRRHRRTKAEMEAAKAGEVELKSVIINTDGKTREVTE